jgi:hypothetical protein
MYIPSFQVQVSDPNISSTSINLLLSLLKEFFCQYIVFFIQNTYVFPSELSIEIFIYGLSSLQPMLIYILIFICILIISLSVENLSSLKLNLAC